MVNPVPHGQDIKVLGDLQVVADPTQELVEGIIPLEEREGKIDDKRLPTILDWAKNCPLTYAEKLKYEEVNLSIWVWGC